MAAFKNIHGRKWGRGVRPWLLIPKCFCVAVLIGGLFALALLTVASQLTTGGEQSQFAWTLIRAIFRYQIIPATIGAVILGLLLFVQHLREFGRMRWMRVKLAAVVIAVPFLHIWLSTNLGLHTKLMPGLLTALAVFGVIAVLGRLKPRLGQGYRMAP